MRNFKKPVIVVVVAAAALCAAAFPFGRKKAKAAAPAAAESPYNLRVGVLTGPSGIPCARLMEHVPDIAGASTSFEVLASAQAELPKLVSGEIDIGFLPPNAAAKVFTANNGAVVALGICGNGNLFLLSKNGAYLSFADLKGKKVACAGMGATPEYMFTYLLAQHGIGVGTGADKVELDFSTPNANIAAALTAGKFEYALVPEPFATVASVKDSAVRRVADIQKEFAAVSGGDTYPMTLLVANASFAQSHRDIITQFITAFTEASDWTTAHPDEAGVLVQKHNLGLLAPVAAKSIPNAAYTWEDAQAGRARIEKLLSIFLGFAPASVGGALPSDSFYY